MIIALAIPFTTLGILLTAYIALISLRTGQQRELLTVVLAILSFSIIYVIADLAMMILAVSRGNPSLVAQLNRILELAATGLMPLVPYFVKTALPLRKRWRGMMQAVSLFCFISAALILVIAMTVPDYFISLDQLRAEESLYSYGRGRKGPVLIVRDLLFMTVLVLSFIIMLFQRPWRYPKNPRTGLLYGFSLALLLGANAIINNFFEDFGVLRSFGFSRVGIAIVIFSLSSVLYYVRQFSLQALELNEVNRELNTGRARLGFLAYHNELTQLPNRTAFLRDLNTLIESLRYSASQVLPFGHLIAFDLNGFNSVMNSYGPRISDMTLIAVSKRLQGILTRSQLVDAGAYHFGGDNFALLVPLLKRNQESGNPPHIIESLKRSMSKPFSVEGTKIYLSASFAHVALDELGPSAEELSRRLSRTLGEAKQRRNFALSYTGEMEAQVRRRIDLIQRMREALRREEFVLMYQPILDARGECREAEALIRWRPEDPDFEVPGPNIFIPAAEESGLILPLTEWIVAQVCRDLTIMRQVMPELRIYLNISPKHLESAVLDQFILKKLIQAGIPTSALGVEITETAIMSRQDAVRSTLEALGAAGIKIAIDDFGTGYSSLRYLKEIPADRIKVDRSFIAGIPDHNEDMALVESVASLGVKLGKQVVAEGIETDQQRLFCLEQGITHLQGYLFATPLALDAFLESWLKKSLD